MSQKRAKLDFEDEDSFQCMFCLENWKKRGSHKLVSLKCGHLFGESCIQRWIEERSEKYGSKNVTCPICMKPVKSKDIISVQPTKLVAKDTSGIDKLTKELDLVKTELKEQQNALELSKLALGMCKRELAKAIEKKD